MKSEMQPPPQETTHEPPRSQPENTKNRSELKQVKTPSPAVFTRTYSYK